MEYFETVPVVNMNQEVECKVNEGYRKKNQLLVHLWELVDVSQANQGAAGR